MRFILLISALISFNAFGQLQMCIGPNGPIPCGGSEGGGWGDGGPYDPSMHANAPGHGPATYCPDSPRENQNSGQASSEGEQKYIESLREAYKAMEVERADQELCSEGYLCETTCRSGHDGWQNKEDRIRYAKLRCQSHEQNRKRWERKDKLRGSLETLLKAKNEFNARSDLYSAEVFVKQLRQHQDAVFYYFGDPNSSTFRERGGLSTRIVKGIGENNYYHKQHWDEWHIGHQLVYQSDRFVRDAEEAVGNGVIEGVEEHGNFAMTLLDAITSWAPGVSLARDFYEAIYGEDLVTGGGLSLFERSMSVLGVATGGFGNKPFKAIKSLGKLMHDGGAVIAKAESILEAATKLGWKLESKVFKDLSLAIAHIKAHKKMPDRYIKKAEAEALGWSPRNGNLAEVAPGKMRGGDVWSNKIPQGECFHALPTDKTYIEMDLGYSKGYRGTERLVVSDDLEKFYITNDHYKTFTEIP